MFHVTYTFDNQHMAKFDNVADAIAFAKDLKATRAYRMWCGHVFHIWNNTTSASDKVNRYV